LEGITTAHWGNYISDAKGSALIDLTTAHKDLKLFRRHPVKGFLYLTFIRLVEDIGIYIGRDGLR
jgi:hypothetical protein